MFESDVEKQLRQAREEERKRFHLVLKQLNDIIVERLECLFYILARDNITESYLKGAVREMFVMLKKFKKELVKDKDTGKGLYSDEKLAMFARKLTDDFMQSEGDLTKTFEQLKEKLLQNQKSLKDLTYYMILPYKVKYKKIPKDDGGGWSAYIPQLGEFAFRGDGETKEEALRSLNFIKRELFKDYLKEGINIPKPGIICKTIKELKRELINVERERKEKGGKMSADNWTICPKCHQNRVAVKKPEYGKVTEKEYLASLDKEEEPEEETMREDYEIGIDENGLFEITYECYCETCGFKYTFNHKEHVAQEKK